MALPRCATLLALVLSVARSDTCDSGITLTGIINHKFDGDYLLQYLLGQLTGGPNGQRYGGPVNISKTPNSDASIGKYTISPGCLGKAGQPQGIAFVDNCTAADQQKTKGKWVLYTSTEYIMEPWAHGHVPSNNKVVAICTSGCPPAESTQPWFGYGRSVWPGSGSFQTTWELTGEEGPAGSFDATASCCTRVPQQCDNNKCSSHHGFLGISKSCDNDACCLWECPEPTVPFNCKCKVNQAKILTKCEHSQAGNSNNLVV